MKREVIFIIGIILFLGLVSFASAACDSVIMRLQYGTEYMKNAHGALWNQNLGSEICYNDLFTGNIKDLGEEADLHECDSDNVLYLNAVNNSHASIEDSEVYNIPVCHKGLEGCRIGGDCEGDLDCNIVAYISGTTNAHLSEYPTIGYDAISCTCAISGCEKKEQLIGPDGCYDYEDEYECTNYQYEVAMGTGCNGESCYCVWNNETETCAVKWDIMAADSDCKYSCAVEGSEATECSADNNQIIRTIAKITSDSNNPLTCDINTSGLPAGWCKSGSATVLCGSLEEAALPFFGLQQIVSSLISIAFVYALINKRRLF